MLLSCERYSAEDGDEDEDGGDFKGQQQVAEEDAAEIAGGGEVFAEAGRAEVDVISARGLVEIAAGLLYEGGDVLREFLAVSRIGRHRGP